MALLLQSRPGLIHGRVVHFAPERWVINLIKPLAEQYQSADLFRAADLKLDIEAIALPDNSADVIIASHVLEHVNDRKALPEIYRCLKPGGVAIFMLPVVEGWKSTYENSSVTSDADRSAHFGQFDHVRYYGADIRDRIRSAGFELEEFTASGEECVRFGLWRGETVFIATRPRQQ